MIPCSSHQEGERVDAKHTALTPTDAQELVRIVKDFSSESFGGRSFEGLDGEDLGVLRGKLNQELTALQRANVFDILGSQSLVTRVSSVLDTATEGLHSMSRWLHEFGGRLEALGVDVRTIEGRNGALETHARDATALADVLESQLADTDLPAALRETLHVGPLQGPQVHVTVAAAAELLRRQRALEDRKEVHESLEPDRPDDRDVDDDGDGDGDGDGNGDGMVSNDDERESNPSTRSPPLSISVARLTAESQTLDWRVRMESRQDFRRLRARFEEKIHTTCDMALQAAAAPSLPHESAGARLKRTLRCLMNFRTILGVLHRLDPGRHRCVEGLATGIVAQLLAGLLQERVDHVGLRTALQATTLGIGSGDPGDGGGIDDGHYRGTVGSSSSTGSYGGLTGVDPLAASRALTALLTDSVPRLVDVISMVSSVLLERAGGGGGGELGGDRAGGGPGGSGTWGPEEDAQVKATLRDKAQQASRWHVRTVGAPTMEALSNLTAEVVRSQPLTLPAVTVQMHAWRHFAQRQITTTDTTTTAKATTSTTTKTFSTPSTTLTTSELRDGIHTWLMTCFDGCLRAAAVAGETWLSELENQWQARAESLLQPSSVHTTDMDETYRGPEGRGPDALGSGVGLDGRYPSTASASASASPTRKTFTQPLPRFSRFSRHKQVKQTHLLASSVQLPQLMERAEQLFADFTVQPTALPGQEDLLTTTTTTTTTTRRVSTNPISSSVSVSEPSHSALTPALSIHVEGQGSRGSARRVLRGETYGLLPPDAAALLQALGSDNVHGGPQTVPDPDIEGVYPTNRSRNSNGTNGEATERSASREGGKGDGPYHPIKESTKWRVGGRRLRWVPECATLVDAMLPADLYDDVKSSPSSSSGRRREGTSTTSTSTATATSGSGSEGGGSQKRSLERGGAVLHVLWIRLAALSLNVVAAASSGKTVQKSKPLHGLRVHLENLAWLAHRWRPKSGSEHHTPPSYGHDHDGRVHGVVAKCPRVLKMVEVALDVGVGTYVRLLLHRVHLDILEAHVVRMEGLAKLVGIYDVRFHYQMSQRDTDDVAGAVFKDLDGRIQLLRAKVRRHLGEDRTGLEQETWQRLRGGLVAQYSRLAELYHACYGDELRPAPAEVLELLKAA